MVGRLREIPGVFSQGENIDDLKTNIKDAYKLLRESDKADFLPPDRHEMPLEINAIAEGLNRIIKIVKNRASGFQSLSAFIDMIFLTVGDVDIPAQIPVNFRAI